jgi:ribonuclease-3
LDAGFETARTFVLHYLFDGIMESTTDTFKDYKTALQEQVQRDHRNTLSYRMTGESGPDHAKCFFAEVLINGEMAGAGKGESKKAAEQSAAREALRIRYGLEE